MPLESELPIETALVTSDYCRCLASVAGVETSINIKWSDLITVLNLRGSGSVIAVKNVISTLAENTTGTWTNITGLSITYTPTNAANNILLLANISVGAQDGSGNTGIQFLRGTTPIGIGVVTGSQTAVSACIGSKNSDSLYSLSSTFLDSPATTSSTTWKIQYSNVSNGFGRASINSTFNDSNAVGTARGISTFTLMEVTP